VQIYDGSSAKYCAELVNMCQGSRYRNDMRKYNPIVEIIDTIRFVKMLFPSLYGFLESVL